MIKPALQGEAFLADVRDAANSQDDLHIWWLGQSGFLVQWRGSHLLFDPYLSDSLSRKYAATDKPHTRMTGLVISPDALDFIDLTTSSHNHTDHLDGETLTALIHANPKMELLVPSANCTFAAERLDMDPDQLETIDAGQSIALGPFELHAVPAAHEDLAKDDLGRHQFVGYVAKLGPWTVYHSGDTIPYDGMEEILRQWKIDVALLPINGRRPERQVAGNLWGREAANLAKAIGVRMVIPCHYDMFEFNTETPEEFEITCQALGQAHKTIRAGQRWSSFGLK
jgi:L-ascorbate metabolism protein UlaG (beta-lactamase superfamily)|tara:strand:- start:1334 stop:2182 length:849 start_codon:yes stop_codon:yes gene_type:complete